MMPLDLESFSPTTFEEWKKMVTKELGERPFDSLLWDTQMGFSLQPYYETGKNATVARTSANWQIGQSFSGTEATVHEQVMDALQGGVEALFIQCSSSELSQVLDGVFLDIISTHWNALQNPLAALQMMQSVSRQKGYDLRQLRGSLQTEKPTHQWSAEEWEEVAVWSKEHTRHWRPFTLDAKQVHTAGGHAVHELAFALAAAQECTAHLIEKGFSIDEVSAWFHVHFSTGNAYFVEIAKFRAFRQLWSNFIQAYSPAHACSKQILVHAESSSYLQTVNDAYNNLLRGTTQAMSAIIGGADSINVLPFDACFQEPSNSALRWARNIQHLLREESYFDQLIDAGKGSFYIEELTLQLSEQAWLLFQEIEKRGGLKKAETWFFDEVKKYAEKQQEAVRSGKRIVVGVNKYVAKNEEVLLAKTTERLSAQIEEQQRIQTSSQP